MNEMGSLSREMKSELDESWKARAACAPPVADPSLFWPPGNLPAGHLSPEMARREREREAAAKAICARCPVQVECLSYARVLLPAGGIWGGVKFDQPTGRRAGWRKRKAQAEEAS